MEWIYMLFLGCFQLLQCVRNNKLYKQQHMNCFVPQAEQLNSDGPLYPPWLDTAWEEKAADALQSWKKHLQNLIHIK